MMTAGGADTKILLDSQMVYHISTSGAFGPEPLGHFPLFLTRKFEGWFFEDGHDCSFCNKATLNGKLNMGQEFRRPKTDDLSPWSYLEK